MKEKPVKRPRAPPNSARKDSKGYSSTYIEEVKVKCQIGLLFTQKVMLEQFLPQTELPYPRNQMWLCNTMSINWLVVSSLTRIQTLIHYSQFQLEGFLWHCTPSVHLKKYYFSWKDRRQSCFSLETWSLGVKGDRDKYSQGRRQPVLFSMILRATK